MCRAAAATHTVTVLGVGRTFAASAQTWLANDSEKAQTPRFYSAKVRLTTHLYRFVKIALPTPEPVQASLLGPASPSVQVALALEAAADNLRAAAVCSHARFSCKRFSCKQPLPLASSPLLRQ